MAGNGDASSGPRFLQPLHEVGQSSPPLGTVPAPHPTRPAAQGTLHTLYTSTRINTIVSLVFPCHTRAADAQRVLNDDVSIATQEHWGRRHGACRGPGSPGSEPGPGAQGQMLPIASREGLAAFQV